MKILRKPLVIALLILFYSCNQDYTPKPRGYFRIDLPDKEYTLFDTTYPYIFEYPVYANISPHQTVEGEKYWIDIEFPDFNGNIHVSYKQVDNNLVIYLEDAREFVVKHIPKASSIEDQLILDRERNVFGLSYNIKGSGTASPFQFFLTDSSNHFVRGALYFETSPNNDSLAPVIEFLKDDIEHLIETFRWKDN